MTDLEALIRVLNFARDQSNFAKKADLHAMDQLEQMVERMHDHASPYDHAVRVLYEEGYVPAVMLKTSEVFNGLSIADPDTISVIEVSEKLRKHWDEQCGEYNEALDSLIDMTVVATVQDLDEKYSAPLDGEESESGSNEEGSGSFP